MKGKTYIFIQETKRKTEMFLNGIYKEITYNFNYVGIPTGFNWWKGYVVDSDDDEPVTTTPPPVPEPEPEPVVTPAPAAAKKVVKKAPVAAKKDVEVEAAAPTPAPVKKMIKKAAAVVA